MRFSSAWWRRRMLATIAGAILPSGLSASTSTSNILLFGSIVRET